MARAEQTFVQRTADSELHGFLEDKGIVKTPVQAKRDELVSQSASHTFTRDAHISHPLA